MGSVSISGNDALPLIPAVVDSAAGGVIAAPAGVPNKVIKVYRLFLVMAGATNITFQDGNDEFDGPLPMVANGTIVFDIDGNPWFTTSPGNAFNINSSAAVQVSGTVYYQIANAQAF